VYRLGDPVLYRLSGTGTTAVHICFGYPAFVPDHPQQYSFLAELGESTVDQISVETAQSGVGLSVLDQLEGRVGRDGGRPVAPGSGSPSSVAAHRRA
jgi:5-methyltetrahydropteroyltriglutamate--homocysteine methyltransferase